MSRTILTVILLCPLPVWATAPLAPDGLQIVGRSHDSITLRWYDSSNVHHYFIYAVSRARQFEGNEKPTPLTADMKYLVGKTNTGEFTHRGLDPFMLYQYVITSADEANNESSPSRPIAASTTSAEQLKGVPAFRGRIMHRDDFDTNRSLNNWTKDGIGNLELDEDRLIVESTASQKAMVVWFDPLVDDLFELSIQLQPLSDHGSLTLAFCAAEGHGHASDQNGSWKNYTPEKMHAYLLELHSNGRVDDKLLRRHLSRVWLVPEMTVLSLKRDPAADMKPHFVNIIKKRNYVQIAVDDEVVHRFAASPQLGRGRVGIIHQDGAKAAYDHFRIYAVLEVAD